MPIDITDISATPVSERYKTAYDQQFETLPQMSLSVPRSKYDEGYIYNQSDPEGSLTEQRAQKQSGLAKLGTGIGKGVVLTGTTAADGIIGTAIGLVNMAVEGKASAFWDDPFSKAMNDINDASEQWMPTYQTKASKNASFIGQMGYADFWADKFLKNIGFTAGMILDGMITGGASMELMGAKSIASKLPKAIAAAAMQGDRALGAALEAKDAIKLSSEVIKNANKLSLINRTSQGLGSVLAAQGESRFEALNNSTDFYNQNKLILDNDLASGKYTKEQYDQKLTKLTDAKEGYGNADFLANAVILGVSNGIQFKNIFTRGFTPTENIAKGIVGDVASGYRYDKPLVQQTAKIAKNILAEGVWEEQGQYAAQKASDDFYQRKFDGKSQDSINDMFKSVYSGLSEAYGTRAGWDQGLIGSLTGAIGLPGIERNAKSGHLKPTWHGGIWGDIQEVKEENEFNKDAVDHLNTTLQGDAFKNNYQSLTRLMSLEDDKIKAAAKGDKYETLNKQHEQFINDALSFIKAGKYEDFKDNITAIKNSNAEEVRQLFKTKSSTIADDISNFYGVKPENQTITPEQQPYVDTFKDYTSDEIVKKLNKNADEMTKDAENIRKLYTAYSTLYPGISEDAKEALIYHASMLDNLNKRITNINDKSRSKFGVDINNNVKFDTEGDNYKVNISDYIKQFKANTEEGVLNGSISPADVISFQEDLKDLPKLLVNKLVHSDAYHTYTTGKGIFDLEEKVKQSKEVPKDTIDTPPTPEDESTDTTIDRPNDETTNDDENPEWYKTPLGKRQRGLTDVASALSHSHYDPETKKTVVRNNEFDKHVSSPTNDLKGDKLTMSVDTSTDDDYKARVWSVNKQLKDKLDSKQSLTQDEANNLINHIRTTQGEDNFDSLVDILPIKATYNTKEGRVFDKGLYYHDSRYDNIRIPQSVKDQGENAIRAYIKSQKERTRENRKKILLALLTGKEVTMSNIKKTKGIPNNTGVNRNINEVLKISHNQIRLGIATANNNIFTGSTEMEGYGSPGNVFFETNKTANGESATVQANVQKLTKEHAEILWNSILTKYHPSQRGENSVYNGDEVEGLTVGEVIDMLVNMGQHTNLNSKKFGKDLPEYLITKQLFVDSDKVLHYGTSTLQLVGGIYRKDSGISEAEEKRKFIEWATTNKNYTINKKVDSLGIELNKMMTKKFKIGSWISDGKDTYAGSVIKQGMVKTDVDEFENTGSLFHAPVTIVDLSESGLTIQPSKATKETNTKLEKEVTKAAKSTPKNKVVESKPVEIGEKVYISNYYNGQLRSIPTGTDIYLESTKIEGQGEDAVETTTTKLSISIVDVKGKKFLKLVSPSVRRYFDIEFDAKGDQLLDMNDDKNIENLRRFTRDFKDKVYMNTSKSTQGVIQNNKLTDIEEWKKKIEDRKIRVGEIFKINPLKAIDEVIRKKQIVATDSLGRPLSDYQSVQQIPGVKSYAEAEQLVKDYLQSIRPENYKFGDEYDYSKYDNENIIDESIKKINPTLDINSLTGINDVSFGDDPFRLVDKPLTTYEVANIEKETKWLQDKFGKDVPIEVVNGLIYVARSGKKAFGQLRGDTIVLSNVSEKGTSYHEAFHRVNLLLRTEQDRQSTYNEARKKWKLTNQTDREVEEYLAEQFRGYVINKEADKPTGIIGRIGEWFKQLFNYVKNIFTGNNRLTNLDIDHLFESIQSSKFRNISKVSTTDSVYELEVRGDQLENIATYKQYRSIIRGLASISMKSTSDKLFPPKRLDENGNEIKEITPKYAIIDIVDSIADLDLNKTKDTVISKIEEFNKAADSHAKIIEAIEKGNITPELLTALNKKFNTTATDTKQLAGIHGNMYSIAIRRADLWQEVVDNYDNIFKEAVQNYIANELNIKSNIDEDDDITNKEIANHDKTSYQYSAKHNILHSIKFLLSNIHASDTRNEYTGMYEFVTMDEIWSRLMSDLHSQDSIEDMISILEKKDYYPYVQLAKKLKEGSELLRTQFQTSFIKHRHAFVNAMFTKSINKDNGLMNYKFFFTNADIHKASTQTIKTWGELFALSNMINKNNRNEVDPKQVEEVNKIYESIRNRFREVSKNTTVDLEPYKTEVVNLLNLIKISVDNKTIDKVLTDYIKDNKASTDTNALKLFIDTDLFYLFGKYSTLHKYANKETDKDSSVIDLTPKTLFRNESVIKTLATAFVEVNPQDLSNTLPGANGDLHYVYSDHSYVTQIVKELSSDNTEVFDNLKSDIFSRYSYLLKQLDEPITRSKFSVSTFNAFIQDKSADNGRGYLDISPVEDFLFKLSAYEAGYMAMPTLADRKSYYMPKGINLPTVKLVNDQISEDIIDIFHDYAKAERDRIQQAHALIKKAFKTNSNGDFIDNKGEVVSEHSAKKVLINPDILVNFYHYNKNGDVYNTGEGLAFKYQLFSSFNKEGFDFDTNARDEIKRILEHHIKETTKEAIKLGVITTNNEAPLIDKELFDKRTEEYNSKELAIKSIMSSYTISTLISSVESMMLFSGDMAFYKPSSGNPTDDYVKRLSVLTSSGALLRLTIPGEFTNSDYTTTTLTAPKFGSSYYDLLYNKHFELLKTKYTDKDDEFIKKIVEKNLKAYTKLDPTDAQVYISPEMHREISIRRGEWSPEKQDAYELLQSTDPITPEEESRLLEIAMQPLKYVYFDRIPQAINDKDNLLISTYDKMSIATLFRRYVAGTHMEDVLDRMESKGKYSDLPKIHMVKYDTAVKAGNRTTTTLFDKVNTDGQEMRDLSTLSLYQQNFKYLRHQVVTDPHHVQDTLFGTQAKKVGLANIIDDAIYNIDGKPTTGEQVKTNINNALSELSNKGLDKLFKELQVNEEGSIDEKHFQDILYKEGKATGLAENVLEGLRIGLTMDAMPERKWVYSRIISMINRNTIDLHLPGNQLIQLSGFGLGQKESISKFDKTNDLKFIFDDDATIKGIEAKVSVSVFNPILPKELDTFEKKVEWLKNNPSILEGLGYRIPTQGQNSMVPISVKEFLPEQLGDVIILPNEFTALTGSDFDIDKLFFIRYNYSTNNGKVSKVKLDETKSLQDNTKEAVQNYLIDHYRGVLLSEHNFLSSSAPLGAVTDKLKSLSNDVMKAESKDRESLDFASPVFQAAVKYKYSGGKFGVGPEALNNVHHVMCQVAKISFKDNIGVGLTDEKGNNILYGTYGLPEKNGEKILISDWLSALIDSHVDIAKDPYIINLNVVRLTYNVANLLVRVGIGQKTFEFLSQPILKELVAESLNEKGNISVVKGAKPDEIVYEKYNDKAKKLAEKEGVDYTTILSKLEDYDPLKDEGLIKLIQASDKDKDAEWYAKQVKILDRFTQINDTFGKDLNSLVMATRVDTKKYGKNPTEIRIYEQSVDSLIKDNKFNNLDKLLSLDPSIESSFISTYYRNSINLVNQLFKDKTITATKGFNSIIDEVLVKMKKKGSGDESTINNIADEIFSAMSGRFFSDSQYLKINTDRVRKIMSDVVNFVDNYTELYPEVSDNFLLQSLAKGKSVEDGMTFLGIPGIKSDDNFTKEDLSYAWIELLNSNNPEVVEFAKQLVVYSYYTSGFKKGAYSIFHYIPAKVLKELQYTYTNTDTNEKQTDILSYNDYMKSLIGELSGINSITEGISDEIFKNNWWNPNYVPTITEEDIANIIPTKAKEPAIMRVVNKSYLLGYNNDKQPIYRPYINLLVNNNNYLMEYVGYIPEQGNVGVYKLTDKRGYSNKGRVIKEYGLDKSMIDSNNVTNITREMVNKATSGNSNYRSFIYIDPEYREVNTNKIDSKSNPAIIDTIVVDNNISEPSISAEDRSLNGEANNSINSTETFEQIKQRVDKTINDTGAYHTKGFVMNQVEWNSMNDDEKNNFVKCL